MTKIIGFAGKKQSGKNTACNYLYGLQLLEHGVCENISLNEFGELMVSDIFGDTVEGVDLIPFRSKYINIESLSRDFNPCRMYSFAYYLKKFLVEVFGLEPRMVNGTDKDKSSMTCYKWENMPGVITPKNLDYLDYNIEELGLVKHEEGAMTARELMQFFGTEICRKIYQDIWVDAVLNKIVKEAPDYALISDVRFDNEIVGIQKVGGIVIGLTRNSKNDSDGHASEKINLDLCDIVIDNENLSIEAFTKELVSHFIKIRF